MLSSSGPSISEYIAILLYFGVMLSSVPGGSNWDFWYVLETRNNHNPLSVSNKMQRYTIFFIAVEALHVSGGLLDIYQMLCVQFELLDDGWKNNLKHAELRRQ
jgi:hypothetical protein